MSDARFADPALEALFYPFESGELAWPEKGEVLFMGARVAPSVRRYASSRLSCLQWFKPEYDALERARIATTSAPGSDYALILLLPPRQRDQARALYVEAARRLSSAGMLVVSQANSEGAKSCQSDLERLMGAVSVLSKHKCRVLWTMAGTTPDAALTAEWADKDCPSRMSGEGLWTRPGVFSWDRVDPASRLLAEHLPSDLTGRAADLGAGYGYLSAELLARCPGICSLALYEADQRALSLAEANLQEWQDRRELSFHWHDVCSGLPDSYDCIISNPPFHALQGHDRPDLGRAFLRRAAEALAPGGRLWFVANRHLPYEAELASGFEQVNQVVQSGGYKIIEARRSRAYATRSPSPGSRRQRGPGA